jgi:alpha-galactosidase/6-phospho-beta-glucosidase family protein
MFKHVLLASAFSLMAFAVSAQESKEKPEVDYSKVPAWIEMMKDPQVNYYTATEAFEKYWESRIEPEEESELITEGKITKEQADSMKHVRSSWTQAQLNDYMEMKYQFKRFKDWKRSNFPYVQPDGRILSEQERLEIWQKQQKELNGSKK